MPTDNDFKKELESLPVCGTSLRDRIKAFYLHQFLTASALDSEELSLALASGKSFSLSPEDEFYKRILPNEKIRRATFSGDELAAIRTNNAFLEIEETCNKKGLKVFTVKLHYFTSTSASNNWHCVYQDFTLERKNGRDIVSKFEYGYQAPLTEVAPIQACFAKYRAFQQSVAALKTHPSVFVQVLKLLRDVFTGEFFKKARTAEPLIKPRPALLSSFFVQAAAPQPTSAVVAAPSRVSVP